MRREKEGRFIFIGKGRNMEGDEGAKEGREGRGKD
jgi:hypothetical protein